MIVVVLVLLPLKLVVVYIYLRTVRIIIVMTTSTSKLSLLSLPGGSTWTVTTASAAYWSGITSNSVGSWLAACQYEGGIYVSTSG